MPEIFLKFISGASPWLLLLLVVLAVWGKLNWETLNNPAKKASFNRSVGWLREDSFGQLYLRFLGGLMDRVGDWIGDRQLLSQASMAATQQSKGLVRRAFGFNPFTAESYEKCLLLAFMYPVFAYFLAWAMGADGNVGDTSLFSRSDTELGVWQRWSIIGGMLLFMGASLWFVLRWRGWKQWLSLIGVLLLAAGISNWVETEEGVSRLLLFSVFLMIFIPLYSGGWLIGIVLHRSLKKAHQIIYNLAFAVAAAAAVAVAVCVVLSAVLAVALAVPASGIGIGIGTIAVAVAVVVSGSSIGTVALALALALAVSVSASGIEMGTVALAGAVSGIVIIMLQTLQQWSKNKGHIHWFWLIYSFLVIGLGAASLGIVANSDYMLFILLWLLLPLVNAPLDWLSLGFTRGLLQAVRTGNHSGWRTLIWAGADLLLAFGFLFLITAVLVGVTALGNAIAGKTLVDIGCILSKLEADKAHPDHWWIYFMLLSTLVPTLFHFALAGGAATLWLPRKWRTRLANGLKEDMHKTFGAWMYLTFTPVFGFILIPVVLFWSLELLLSANGSRLVTLLLEWATGLAEWADPSMVLVCSAR